MTHADLDPYQERVPWWVRTAAYWAGGTSGTLASLAIGLADAIAPDSRAQVAEITAPVVGFFAAIAGILGVVYRPRPARSKKHELDGEVT